MAKVFVGKLILLSAYYIVTSPSTTESPADAFYFDIHDYDKFFEFFQHLDAEGKYNYAVLALEDFMKFDHPCDCQDCMRIVFRVIHEIYSHPGKIVAQSAAKFYVLWFIRSLSQSMDLDFEGVLQTENIDLPVEGAATTILHKAAAGLRPVYFHMLLDAGANVDLIDNLGRTALHIATAKLDVDKVSLLMGRWVNLEIPDNHGRTALHIACADDDMGRWSQIHAKAESERRTFSQKFFHPRLQIVKMLLNDGAEADARDEFSMTPIHYAVQKQFANIVEALVNGNADVNAKSRYNETPFDIALRLGYDDCFDALLKGDYNEDTYTSLRMMWASESFMHKELFTLRLENMKKVVGEE